MCSSSFCKHAAHASFYPACLYLECVFFYVPRPLIDQAIWNNETFLTTFAMHTCISDTNIYMHIHVYTYVPMESNHRGAPTAHRVMDHGYQWIDWWIDE